MEGIGRHEKNFLNFRLLSVMKLFMDKHFDRDALLELLKTFSTIVLCEKNECIITDILEQNGVEFLLGMFLLLRESLYQRLDY